MLKKNTGVRSRTKYLKVSNGILFIFFIQSIYKRWKGKMENISTTCKLLLQISQYHSPNHVSPPRRFHIVLLSEEYTTQDVYLLLKENFSELSCTDFFSNEE